MEVSLSGIVRWLVGLLFLLVAGGTLIEGHYLAFLIAILIAIVCIPAVADPIERKTNITMTGAVRFLLVFVLIIGMGIAIPNTSPTKTNDVATSVAADTADTNQAEAHATQSSTAPVATPTSTPKETPVGSTDDTEKKSGISKTTSSSNEPVKEIVSTSFSDFTPYLDSTSTELQKETFFNDNFKDKYVTWTGTVTTVTESWGSYTVSVKHSPNTFTSDVIVKMRDDQKNKLLQLKEGSKITYTAKMTRYGELLGMSAEDGVIE